jgi:pyruvate kinase
MNTDNFRDMLWVACDIGKKKGLVTEDTDLLVVTAGFPFGTPGAANIIRVIPGKHQIEIAQTNPSLLD